MQRKGAPRGAFSLVESSDPFEYPCGSLPHAHAHGDHAVFLLVALQCVHHGGGTDGASRAQRVAEWLEARDDVRHVNFAGLASSPWHANQLKYAPRGAGAVLSFELEGGTAAGQAFVSALELHSNVANIGDVRSLVIHPASTTHSQLSPEEQALSGVTPGLVRLAVGIEHIDDILADLDAGFRAAKGA